MMIQGKKRPKMNKFRDVHKEQDPSLNPTPTEELETILTTILVAFLVLAPMEMLVKKEMVVLSFKEASFSALVSYLR